MALSGGAFTITGGGDYYKRFLFHFGDLNDYNRRVKNF